MKKIYLRATTIPREYIDRGRIHYKIHDFIHALKGQLLYDFLHSRFFFFLFFACRVLDSV